MRKVESISRLSNTCIKWCGLEKDWYVERRWRVDMSISMVEAMEPVHLARGFGDEDRFVVITDVQPQMNMLLFGEWVPQIGSGFPMCRSTYRRPVARYLGRHLIAVQSEQSVVVSGWCLVVNNTRNIPCFARACVVFWSAIWAVTRSTSPTVCKGLSGTPSNVVWNMPGPTA